MTGVQTCALPIWEGSAGDELGDISEGALVEVGDSILESEVIGIIGRSLVNAAWKMIERFSKESCEQLTGF